MFDGGDQRDEAARAGSTNFGNGVSTPKCDNRRIAISSIHTLWIGMGTRRQNTSPCYGLMGRADQEVWPNLRRNQINDQTNTKPSSATRTAVQASAP
jgi:hypothetical protein